MPLTFCIGDLLGCPRIPPDLLEDPCEGCGKEEAAHSTFDIDGGIMFSGEPEKIRVCKTCLPRYECVGIDEMEGEV